MRKQIHRISLVCLVFGIAWMCYAAQDNPAWTRKHDLPEGRIFEIAAAVNGRIYAVTSGEDGKPPAEVWEYNPALDQWKVKGHANQPRTSFGAGEVKGKIYIWGGMDGNRLIGSTEMYDPESDTWTVRAELPRPRIFAKGAAVAGKLYAVGGIAPPYRNQVPLLDEYDPVSDRWTPKSDWPSKRDGFRVAACDGKIYVMGHLGHDPATLQYDPATDRWAIRAPMPSLRSDFGIHASKGLIYTFGGMESGALEVYNAGADRWIKKRDMPQSNWAQVAAEVNGRIFVIGGGFPVPLKVLYEYDPAKDR